MSPRVSFDPNVSFEDQLESEHEGPVTVIGTFTLPSNEAMEAFLEPWATIAEFVRIQPGCMSLQLHRGIDANVFVAYSVWESIAAYQAAGDAERANSALKEVHKRVPGNITVAGVLVEKVAVPGVCLA